MNSSLARVARSVVSSYMRRLALAVCVSGSSCGMLYCSDDFSVSELWQQ